MPKDYIIAIGGTGARCLEAVGNLAAAGLFQRPLHVLMIDPDQNNGNSVRTKRLFALYHALYMCEQPRDVKQWSLLAQGRRPAEPTIFQAAVNAIPHAPGQQFPVFWQDPNKADRQFGEAISFPVLSPEFQNFARLFYEQEDLDMKMGKGYRGRPNIGAVTLMADLERTIDTPGKGLFEMVESIRADLKSDVVRVFIFGSVFGGTGAAGLPTIPELLRKRFRRNGDDRKLRFGCAMMTPYFTFEKAQAASSAGGPAPDSDIHQVATQAALLHYAGVPPGYQHAYVVGAPELLDSKVGHQAGGEAQVNDSHYAEVVAALGARDFFTLAEVAPDERHLHYADAPEVGWAALPATQAEQDDPRELKHRLVAFTTFAYLYENVLHEDMKDGRWRSQQAWYKDNFVKRNLALDTHGQTLDALRDFCGDYLAWFAMVGQALRAEEGQLFNWGVLSLTGDDAARELGRLIKPESEESPRYAGRSYGKLMEKLNRLKPSYSNRAHPVGLLVYLLYQAALEFSTENYYFK